MAKDARQRVSVEMPPGLELTLWASERMLSDPVAIDLDERGTAYVTSTSRNNLPLDIRQHPDWVPTVHTLKTVEDLRAFYRRELAPERSARNGWITDLNKDGSRDFRDFAEFKERVYRIRDTDGDGLADDSRIIAEGFNDDPVWDVAGGVLVARRRSLPRRAARRLPAARRQRRRHVSIRACRSARATTFIRRSAGTASRA